MDLVKAFQDLQNEVNADPEQVAEARRRRNLFRDDAFDPEPDIDKTYASGSLARGSQIEPIKDVDLLIVFNREDHLDWDGGPGTAEQALKETQQRVRELLGADGGRVAKEVRLTRIQNHAVKCFLDDPNDPDAFTVDVVPALRHEERGFEIPEKDSDKWIRTDPLYLIKEVLDRHEASEGTFVPLLRVLKRWSKDHGKPLKGLTIEVLALDVLPLDESRPYCLSSFFTGAVARIDEPIEDPGRLCGEVQPDLDREAAREKLNAAGELAWRGVEAERRGETDRAACLWRKVFGGGIFPAPPQGCDDATGALRVAAGAAAIPRRRVQDLGQG
jgi:predicted nucleotidyltransferase